MEGIKFNLLDLEYNHYLSRRR